MKIHLLVVFLLLPNIQAQQQQSCFCSCCYGQSCNPTRLPTVYVQDCTLTTCIAQCRSTYPQCQVNYPHGELSAQCGTSLATSTGFARFKCQCYCCNTGSTCSPSFVGETSAHTCQTGSCSIACNQQFPNQCQSGIHGQTQGTCTDLITTTSTTTTVSSWLGHSCSCMCCQSGSNCSPTYVGTASASYCSSVHCATACRIQYPAQCPTLVNIGQTNGACTSVTGGKTICRCRCLGNNNNNINYDVRTSGDCSTCESLCRQQTPCLNTVSTSYTCEKNYGKITFPSIIVLFIMISFILISK